MKNKPFWKPALAVFLVIVAAIIGIILYHRSGFTGSRAANPDSYRLDIQRMNGTDTHTLELFAGDTLEIHFETQTGSLHMELQAPDGTVLYAGDGKVATDFTVSISETGEYSVTVEGRHAKGTISIQRKPGKPS